MIGADFSVVLLPTLACNAACDYCFEQHRVGMLDHERLELIVRRLRERGSGSEPKAAECVLAGRRGDPALARVV